MDDARVWAFEDSLWKADEAHYRESIAPDYLLVIPAPPYVLMGEQAVHALAQTPRWQSVAFSDQHVSRPHEGLIVVAYHVEAAGGGEGSGEQPYSADCSSVYLRISHENWKVIQHQQTPRLVEAVTQE